jgi:hypothetical protein
MFDNGQVMDSILLKWLKVSAHTFFKDVNSDDTQAYM